MTLTALSEGIVAKECQEGTRPRHTTAFDGVMLSIGCAPRRDGQEMADRDRVWVGRIRRIGCARLRHWGLSPGLIDDVSLVISELVTNAFRYGQGDEVSFGLAFKGGEVRIEVYDGSVFGPCVRDAGVEERGRGMLLVSACADEWGTSDDGATTWCTFTVRGDGRA